MNTYPNILKGLEYINKQFIESEDPLSLSFHLQIILPDKEHIGECVEGVAYRIRLDDGYDIAENEPLIYQLERFRDSYFSKGDLDFTRLCAKISEELSLKYPGIPPEEIRAGVELYSREYDDLEEDFYTSEDLINQKFFD